MTLRRTALLSAVHLLGYPVVIWLIWVWFGMSEASAGELIGSAVLGLVIIAALAALLSSAFQGSFPSRNLWLLALLFIGATLALFTLASWLSSYTTQAGDWIAVRLSNLRGRAINPRRMDWVYICTVWTIFGAITAMILARVVIGTARVLRDWSYWALCVGLVVIGGYVPWKLVTWVPAVQSFSGQTTSMIVRFGAAYLIAVVSLLGFAAAARRRSEADRVIVTPPVEVPTAPSGAA